MRHYTALYVKDCKLGDFYLFLEAVMESQRTRKKLSSFGSSGNSPRGWTEQDDGFSYVSAI